MKVINLRVMHMKDPLGIDINPYFSWIIESEIHDTIQTAYSIIVKEGDAVVWDTGKVESSNNCYLVYSGNTLKSRTYYTISVTVWDNYGNEAKEKGSFETALLQKKDWKAQWSESPIRRKKGRPGFGKQPPATLFRKKFFLNDRPVKARVYATCHGIYELSLNGTRADQRFFAPEHTVYEKYLCYQTFDVTDKIKQGENVLGMHVGDGWYLCPQSLPNMKKQKFSHAVLFQLEVQYQDGSTQCIYSDDNVLVSYGPIECSDLYSGEKYNSNKTKKGWDTPSYCDEGWLHCKIAKYGYSNLKAQADGPVEAVTLLPVKEILHSPKGETILDFGQIIAGCVRMKVQAPKGTEIILEHCEVLDKEGNFFNNIMSEGGVGKGCNQKDVFISAGEEEEYTPHFTYHGFRYVRVQGIDVHPDMFQAVVLSTRKENTGTFCTSDARLNRLYENTKWSQTANMLSIPTDCPQREKAGWTGDMLVYAKTALLNEDCTSLFTRWLANMDCDQDEYGIIPMVVPNDGNYPKTGKLMNLMYGVKGNATSSGWGDAAVIVPYSMYQVTGNTVILVKQYECMKKWCDYIIRQAAAKKPKSSTLPDEIEKYLWNTGYHYGEWLIPSQSKNGLDMKNLKNIMAMSSRYTAPIFGWNSVFTFAKISKILARKYPENQSYLINSRKYLDIADHMKQAIQTGIIRKDGSMPVELMGAYVLPIYFDLVPDEYKEAFSKHLIEIIQKNHGCMDTGFLGTPFLLDALCKIDRLDLAYSLLWQDKCPSWLSEVDAGATTIWESCFGYDEDGNPGALSFNHYSFGCVDDWMFRYIGGIDTDTPGFKHLIFAPKPDGKLKYAKRSFQTSQGKAECIWEVKETEYEKKFHMQITIPCNTTATVILPDGTREEKGSGTYIFEKVEESSYE